MNMTMPPMATQISGAPMTLDGQARPNNFQMYVSETNTDYYRDLFKSVSHNCFSSLFLTSSTCCFSPLKSD